MPLFLFFGQRSRPPSLSADHLQSSSQRRIQRKLRPQPLSASHQPSHLHPLHPQLHHHHHHHHHHHYHDLLIATLVIYHTKFLPRAPWPSYKPWLSLKKSRSSAPSSSSSSSFSFSSISVTSSGSSALHVSCPRSGDRFPILAKPLVHQRSNHTCLITIYSSPSLSSTRNFASESNIWDQRKSQSKSTQASLRKEPEPSQPYPDIKIKPFSDHHTSPQVQNFSQNGFITNKKDFRNDIQRFSDQQTSHIQHTSRKDFFTNNMDLRNHRDSSNSLTTNSSIDFTKTQNSKQKKIIIDRDHIDQYGTKNTSSSHTKLHIPHASDPQAHPRIPPWSSPSSRASSAIDDDMVHNNRPVDEMPTDSIRQKFSNSSTLSDPNLSFKNVNEKSQIFSPENQDNCTNQNYSHLQPPSVTSHPSFYDKLEGNTWSFSSPYLSFPRAHSKHIWLSVKSQLEQALAVVDTHDRARHLVNALILSAPIVSLSSNFDIRLSLLRFLHDTNYFSKIQNLLLNFYPDHQGKPFRLINAGQFNPSWMLDFLKACVFIQSFPQKLLISEIYLKVQNNIQHMSVSELVGAIMISKKLNFTLSQDFVHLYLDFMNRKLSALTLTDLQWVFSSIAQSSMVFPNKFIHDLILAVTHKATVNSLLSDSRINISGLCFSMRLISVIRGKIPGVLLSLVDELLLKNAKNLHLKSIQYILEAYRNQNLHPDSLLLDTFRNVFERRIKNADLSSLFTIAKTCASFDLKLPVDTVHSWIQSFQRVADNAPLLDCYSMSLVCFKPMAQAIRSELERRLYANPSQTFFRLVTSHSSFHDIQNIAPHLYDEFLENVNKSSHVFTSLQVAHIFHATAYQSKTWPPITSSIIQMMPEMPPEAVARLLEALDCISSQHEAPMECNFKDSISAQIEVLATIYDIMDPTVISTMFRNLHHFNHDSRARLIGLLKLYHSKTLDDLNLRDLTHFMHELVRERKTDRNMEIQWNNVLEKKTTLLEKDLLLPLLESLANLKFIKHGKIVADRWFAGAEKHVSDFTQDEIADTASCLMKLRPSPYWKPPPAFADLYAQRFSEFSTVLSNRDFIDRLHNVLCLPLYTSSAHLDHWIENLMDRFETCSPSELSRTLILSVNFRKSRYRDSAKAKWLHKMNEALPLMQLPDLIHVCESMPVPGKHMFDQDFIGNFCMQISNRVDEFSVEQLSTCLNQIYNGSGKNWNMPKKFTELMCFQLGTKLVTSSPTGMYTSVAFVTRSMKRDLKSAVCVRFRKIWCDEFLKQGPKFTATQLIRSLNFISAFGKRVPPDVVKLFNETITNQLPVLYFPQIMSVLNSHVRMRRELESNMLVIIRKSIELRHSTLKKDQLPRLKNLLEKLDLIK